MYTNQRNENSCAYHASAKVLLQNVWQYLVPVRVDRAKFVENNCTRFVDFDVYDANMEGLTEEECGSGGYDKILQFLYLYYLIEDHVSRSSAAHRTVGVEVLPLIFAQQIPQKFRRSTHLPHLADHLPRLVAMLRQLGAAYEASHLKFEHLDLPCDAFDVIKLVLGKGLYLYASLAADQARHGVHIVNVIGGEIVFKNSWGDNRLYQMNPRGHVWLNQRPYKLAALSVIAPFPVGQSTAYDGLAELKELVQTIPGKTRIREQTKPRIFHRGDVVEKEGEHGIFLKYKGDQAVILVKETHKVPVRTLRAPRDVAWDKVTGPLALVVSSDEERLRSLLALLAEQRQIRRDLYGRLFEKKSGKVTKAVAAINAMIDQTEEELLALRHNLDRSSAALERANRQTFFQHVPKSPTRKKNALIVGNKEARVKV